LKSTYKSRNEQDANKNSNAPKIDDFDGYDNNNKDKDILNHESELNKFTQDKNGE